MNCVKINALVTAYNRVEIHGLGVKDSKPDDS